jgi:glyoxylase-like metal-dependent hydrolase (beta-lactamase superfamily II)
VDVSERFCLEEVADGVHAAIVTPGAGAMGNAAIVDLGDRTLVFDTFVTPSAARDLRAAAERLTGRAVSVVVNSHRHADHTLGNQEFVPGAVVISTTATRQRLAGTDVPSQLPAALKRLEESIPVEEDPISRAALTNDLADYRVLETEAAGVRRVLADITFDDHLALHGSRRTAELITYGGGHTSSDAFLYLPADRVALMGDLFFVSSPPGYQHGDSREWRRIIQRVRELDLDRLVPGHGPVGGLADLDVMYDYLAHVEALADSVATGELTRDEAVRSPLPEPLTSLAGRHLLAANLETLLASAA